MLALTKKVWVKFVYCKITCKWVTKVSENNNVNTKRTSITFHYSLVFINFCTKLYNIIELITADVICLKLIYIKEYIIFD